MQRKDGVKMSMYESIYKKSRSLGYVSEKGQRDSEVDCKKHETQIFLGG